MTSKQIFASLAAVSLALGTAACGGAAEEEPVATAPEGPAGVTITDGFLNLPAIPGNPGAVYFTIANASEEQATIRGADMIGSTSAMLHETSEWSGQMDMQELIQVPVPAGETVVFEPGGKHVMVYELGDVLVAGGETEVTLTFVGGDKLSFPVRIRAAGDESTGAAADAAADES